MATIRGYTSQSDALIERAREPDPAARERRIRAHLARVQAELAEREPTPRPRHWGRRRESSPGPAPRARPAASPRK